MNDLPDTLDRLAVRIESLELRVHALEHPAEAPSVIAPPPPNSAPAAHFSEDSSYSQASGMFSLLGKAMLGVAGAYVLRAVAESSSLPRLGVAAIAIAYAMLWLVWAARVPAGAWLASITYACTSALILISMLWELTLRFNVLSPAATALLLGAFACAANAIGWKRDLAAVYWVVNVSAALAALALSIATREMVPFSATLLTMVLLCEVGVLRNHAQAARPLVDLAADIAIAALLFIYFSPQIDRPDYPVVGTPALLAPAMALFLIVAASAIIKTALFHKTITVFEIIQTVIAFLLASASLLTYEPVIGAMILGVVCLALSAVTYAIGCTLFVRAPERRNYAVFATWSAALFLPGTILCIPSPWSAALLGVSAVVATGLGVRFNRISQRFHGIVYLLAAAIVSGLPAYIFHALAAAPLSALPWTIVAVTICAALCYAVCKPSSEENWQQMLLQFVTASVALAALAALLVAGLAALAALGVHPEAHHLALIRTFILCAMVLALAYSGVHWRRVELTRIGYVALAMVAVKLVFEDLSHGHLALIAASIFLFAVTLIAVPRIARTSKRS